MTVAGADISASQSRYLILDSFFIFNINVKSSKLFLSSDGLRNRDNGVLLEIRLNWLSNQLRFTVSIHRVNQSSDMAKRLRTEEDNISGLQASLPVSEDKAPPTKVIVPDTTAAAKSQAQLQQQPMRCSLPPHRDTLEFPSYEEYELHYLQNHVNRCSECGKNFPTLHILNIHIEENHDPVILARRDRGEKTVSHLPTAHTHVFFV